METQKIATAVSLTAALFFVALPSASANAGKVLTAQKHAPIVRHYEVLLKEAGDKLLEHRAALRDHDSRSYYYGRRGQ